MHLSMLAGTTSKIIQIPVYDSSSTVGANLAGLAFNTSLLTCYYNREGVAGAATVVSLLTATKGTWTTAGFVAVDGTNMQGWYELHVPNAALAAGAKSVAIQLDGAANMVPVNILIELTAEDNQTAITVAKNTALSGWTFWMYDSGTGLPKTGLTGITVQRSIDGGAFAACTNSPTSNELSNGAYKIDLSASDLNGRVIALRYAVTGALDSQDRIITEGP